MSRQDARTFETAVLAVVRALAPGFVLTYGEVAAEAGRPGAARAVGRVLRETVEPVPWWRVVRADGRLAPPVADEQARRLAAEGVEIRERRLVGSRATDPGEGAASVVARSTDGTGP